MILGSLQNLTQDRPALAKSLVKGLEYLKNTDFSKLPEGKYEIDGASMYALVQEYQTSLKPNRKAETHQRYIDIQFVYEGAEIIGYGLTDPANEILQDLLAEKDAIFYQSVLNEIDLILTAGMYAIFFPADIHRPCCNYGSGGRVKKVVLKVAVDLL